MGEPPFMQYPWMSYSQAHAYEEEARQLGVSEVARASKGFMREYERAGSARAMRARPLPPGVSGGSDWGQKRNAFVARHLKSYQEHPTHRRYLALIMWAYLPEKRTLRGDSRRTRAATRATSRGCRTHCSPRS